MSKDYISGVEEYGAYLQALGDAISRPLPSVEAKPTVQPEPVPGVYDFEDQAFINLGSTDTAPTPVERPEPIHRFLTAEQIRLEEGGIIIHLFKPVPRQGVVDYLIDRFSRNH